MFVLIPHSSEEIDVLLTNQVTQLQIADLKHISAVCHLSLKLELIYTFCQPLILSITGKFNLKAFDQKDGDSLSKLITIL
jgi:hypothetical protein